MNKSLQKLAMDDHKTIVLLWQPPTNMNHKIVLAKQQMVSVENNNQVPTKSLTNIIQLYSLENLSLLWTEYLPKIIQMSPLEYHMNMKRKFKTVMVINSTNISKTNNRL